MSDPRTVVRSILNDARRGADASVIARRTGLCPEQVLTICKRRRVPITWRHPTRRHDHPPQDIPDHFTLANAELLAERIRQYWADEGYAVDVRIETTGNGRDSVGHIRSDMVNGIPTRRLDTPHDTPQRDGQGHGPVDATRGAGRVMFHDLNVAEINQPVTRKSGESFQ